MTLKEYEAQVKTYEDAINGMMAGLRAPNRSIDQRQFYLKQVEELKHELASFKLEWEGQTFG